MYSKTQFTYKEFACIEFRFLLKKKKITNFLTLVNLNVLHTL